VKKGQRRGGTVEGKRFTRHRVEGEGRRRSK